jgi:transposase InsO family protein
VSRFIDEHRGRFGVEPICRVLGVSASAYYQRATGWRSTRRVEDERLVEQIREVHAANYYAYGYRRTWKALQRAGERVGRDRVKRLMRAEGIQGAKRRGKPWRTTRPDPAARRRPDLVRRDFSAPAPDRLWVADLSYLRCWEGLVFFAFVLDAFSRRVVGWQLAAHMRTTLVLDALRMALGTRAPGADVALVHHSDRGSQPELNRSSQRCARERNLGTAGEGRTSCRRSGLVGVARLSSRRLARGRAGAGDSRVRVPVGSPCHAAVVGAPWSATPAARRGWPGFRPLPPGAR